MEKEFKQPRQAELYQARAILRRLRDWRLQMAMTAAIAFKDDAASRHHSQGAEECGKMLIQLEQFGLDMWAAIEQKGGVPFDPPRQTHTEEHPT